MAERHRVRVVVWTGPDFGIIATSFHETEDGFLEEKAEDFPQPSIILADRIVEIEETDRA